MTTGRRDFFKQLLMATAAAQFVDLDELFWIPKPMITVPGVNQTIIMANVGGNFRFDPILMDISRKYIQNGGICSIRAEDVFPIIQVGDLLSTTSRGTVKKLDHRRDGHIAGVCVAVKPPDPTA